jgi:hypothetical protein
VRSSSEFASTKSNWLRCLFRGGSDKPARNSMKSGVGAKVLDVDEDKGTPEFSVSPVAPMPALVASSLVARLHHVADGGDPGSAT